MYIDDKIIIEGLARGFKMHLEKDFTRIHDNLMREALNKGFVDFIKDQNSCPSWLREVILESIPESR